MALPSSPTLFSLRKGREKKTGHPPAPPFSFCGWGPGRGPSATGRAGPCPLREQAVIAAKALLQRAYVKLP